MSTTEYITYDTFSSLDIRICTILSVEPVPETDKLLRLSIDCGEAEPRQIISGIKHYFEDHTELVGKQAAFLMNLEPRTIKGLVSQGMLLAADNESVLALLSPSNPLPAGTLVH